MIFLTSDIIFNDKFLFLTSNDIFVLIITFKPQNLILRSNFFLTSNLFFIRFNVKNIPLSKKIFIFSCPEILGLEMLNFKFIQKLSQLQATVFWLIFVKRVTRSLKIAPVHYSSMFFLICYDKLFEGGPLFISAIHIWPQNVYFITCLTSRCHLLTERDIFDLNLSFSTPKCHFFLKITFKTTKCFFWPFLTIFEHFWPKNVSFCQKRHFGCQNVLIST